MNWKETPKNAPIDMKNNVPQPNNAEQSSADKQPVNTQNRWHSYLYPDLPHISVR